MGCRRSRGTSRSDRRWPDRYTTRGEVQYHVEWLGILRGHRREQPVRGRRRSSQTLAWQPKRRDERPKNANGNGNVTKGNGNGRGENAKSARSKENANERRSYARNSRNESVSENESGRESANEKRRNDGKWKGERWSGSGCWFSSNGNRRRPLQRLVRTPWCETGLH